MRVAAVAMLMIGSARAWADEPAVPPEPPPQDPTPSKLDLNLEDRVHKLEAENRELQDKVDALIDDHTAVKQHVKELLPLSGKISGYLDIGFFIPSGDGSGIRPDTNHRFFPQYAGEVPDTWVFMGDPLSTAINARGEPADTGPSRAVLFDSVNSQGKSSFIMNSANVSLFGGFSESLQMNLSVDLVPRSRNVSDPSGVFVGDYIDVKLGYLEYRAPWEKVDLSLFAGKFDSTLGIEYRTQDAPDRLTVTPSLICRYTCGRPIGVKARVQLFDEKLALSVAVTNGSNFTELFPFSNEIDTNQMKTVSARLSYKLPFGIGSEIGASGAFGAQDFQPDDSVTQWHYGVDARTEWHDVIFAAEFVQGRANGKTDPGDVDCGLAPCLHYKGAYGLAGYRLSNWLIPFARADWRDALHQSGGSFVYISKVLRETTGVRFEIGTHTVIKVEYTINHELGGVPQFSDNIFTSALVVKF